MPFEPRFRYDHKLVHNLMEIARHREFAEHVRISPAVDLALRRRARQSSTHSSTAIEGNPIALESIAETVAAKGGRSSTAQQEVRNYWRALEWIAEVAGSRRPPDEATVQRLHAIIMAGGHGRPRDRSEYRQTQMQIADSVTGAIEYIAPEPSDLSLLMAELVEWWQSPTAAALPTPLRAGVLAYRFVTIHPFHDGNGRTARALATLELWRGGYEFRGYLAVEDVYARDLQAYYDALQMGLHHNYYFGRHDADLTPWLDFFVETLLHAARLVRDVTEASRSMKPEEDRPRLTRREENVLLRIINKAIEASSASVVWTPAELSTWFGISTKTARDWLAEWEAKGCVEPAGNGRRARAWRVSGEWADLVREALQGEIEEVRFDK